MRSFQRCLGYCTRIRWQFLHTFADAFQRCYKNGTDSARDCRYFAGLYLYYCSAGGIHFSYDLPVANTNTIFCNCIIIFIVIITVSLLFAYFCLYKNNYFNIIDGLAFVLLALTTFFLIIYVCN